jgi:hypothetical protein
MECPLSPRQVLLSLLLASIVGFVSTTPLLADSVTVSWTAPGDDSLSGRATRYDLRYSTQPITAANFGLASAAVNPPLPADAGSSQSATINGLQSGLTYYFAIKSVDETGNWSALSNIYVKAAPGTAGVGGGFGLAFSAPYPNPARESARFQLELPSAMPVRLEVFDIGGRLVRTLLDETRPAGSENLLFDLRDKQGTRLAQGVYLVRARLGESAFMRRLVVTR